MSVTVEQPEILLREELVRNRNSKHQVLSTFLFTGVTAQTTFVMDEGWKPIQVFDDGSLQREGASDEYTLTLDVSTYSIVFAIPPANGNNIDVLAEAWV